jgi:hypothetical protein
MVACVQIDGGRFLERERKTEGAGWIRDVSGGKVGEGFSFRGLLA